MKFEKRTDGEQIPSSPQEDKPSAGRKPVVIYIMILFIVAFLLMALSFVMHQRSNTEVLGELQDSVSAMQEIQSTQDALLDLQDQLDDAEETVEALESAGEETQARSGGGGAGEPGSAGPCTSSSSSTPPAIWTAAGRPSPPSRRRTWPRPCRRRPPRASRPPRTAISS